MQSEQKSSGVEGCPELCTERLRGRHCLVACYSAAETNMLQFLKKS